MSGNWQLNSQGSPAAQSTSKHFRDTPAVQLGRVRIAVKDQQLWPKPAVRARPQPKRAPAGGTPGEVLSWSSLREWKTTEEDSRPTGLTHLKLYGSLAQPLSLSRKFCFYPSIYHLCSQGLASSHLSPDTTLPISPSPQKLQAHPPTEGFVGPFSVVFRKT